MKRLGYTQDTVERPVVHRKMNRFRQAMDPPKREAGGQSEKRKRMVPHAILFVLVAAATNVVYSNSLFGQLILDNARNIAKKEKIHHPTVARVASRNTGEARANADGERQTGNDPRAALPRENVGDYVSGEMIVALRAGGKTKSRGEVMAALHAAEQALPGQVLRRFSLRFGQRTVLVRLPDGVFVTEAVNDMLALKDPRVAYAEPNHVVWAAGVTPNDPSFNLLWGLHNTGQTGGTPDADIDAPEAWDMFAGSSDVIIAVIDSGVDYNHPDLAPNIWINPGESGAGKETNGIDDDGNGYVDDVHGFDFCRRYPLLADSDPMDAHGHGTHVAGTLGAVGNNGLGVVGINWLCKLMCLRFLDAEGVGNYYDAAEALNYAVTMGARVINSSWGGDSYNLTLLDALTVARDAGVLFVAAAGNNATNNDVLPNYPSSYDVDNVVAVAATDHNDELWWASSWGATSVDLAAPGSDIYSTHPPFTNLFLEDFQAVIPPSLGPQLTSEGTNNYWGTTDRGNGNITLRGDVQSYPYRSNSDSAVLTPAFDTIGLPGLALSFYSRREIGNDDAFVVDVWDGAVWQEIYRRCCSSGLPDFFRRTIIDLERYRNAEMQVRFRWLTDNDDNDYHGVEIDDIAIQYVGTDYPGNGYAYNSGTSMATPHVAGAAGKLLAQDPGLSLDALKLRLLLPVDHIPGLDGLVASGGRLNVAQSLLVDGEPTPVAKCRYISLVPANPGQETALRVTLTNLPAPFEGVNGTEMWVGEPREISENAGKVSPLPYPSFMSANLQCEPYCTDFGSLGLLHVTDDEIIPSAVYDVQAIDCDSDFDDEANYSAPLTITTSKWGDLVGNCAVIPCSPPEGVVNMTTDVTASLDKFRNLPNAVLKSRADIEPNLPDWLVNISDVTYVLDAFRGFPYPHGAWEGPGGCP